jgi:hypothetical protein
MAEPVIPEELATASVDRLLTLFAHLVHRIHAYELEHGRNTATMDRGKRDVVRREILRRCDEVGR